MINEKDEQARFENWIKDDRIPPIRRDAHWKTWCRALLGAEHAPRPGVTEYELVLADHRALVRRLDVLLNGAGAAKQASLCDIVAQVQKEGIKAPDYTVHQHPDDAAVDRFAAAMKARMAEMRAKGKSGWDDPAVCSLPYLRWLLEVSIEPVDIGNYAMMIFNRRAT